MTNETLKQDNKIYYLYKITNKINGKIYIGQTVQPNKRWNQHRNDAANPKIPFHYAIKKYGAQNFEFEIIATCKSQDDTNYIETLLVKQYNSFIANGKGYNATHGGMNAPKTEEFKQMMRDWHVSLSPEEKEKRSEMHRASMLNLIETKGHPAAGRIVSEEERELHRKARLEHPLEYTPELRQKMSEAHLGNIDSEETKQNKAESAKLVWDARQEIRLQSGELRCNAPGCNINGLSKYKIIDGVRYCFNHGQKLERSGTLDLLPKHIQKNSSEEERKKCGASNIGRIAHNRIIFNEQQTYLILNDARSNKKIAKDFEVTEKVIKRIKMEVKN